MKIGIVVTLFAVCIVAAVIGHAVYAKLPAHAVEEVDRSPSVVRNCAGLRESAQRLVTPENGFERLFDRAIPFEPDVVFGKDPAALDKTSREYFDAIQRACEAAPESRNSPVLRLLVEGVAHLRSRGCSASGKCYLHLQTDLRDDSDPRLAAVIERAAKRPAISLPPELAGSIENSGVRIDVCGTSEVRKRRGSKSLASPETLIKIYKGLFTHPELVSFQPYCGQ